MSTIAPERFRLLPAALRRIVPILLACFLMIALFAAFQRRLIYYPSKESSAALGHLAQHAGFAPLENPAGETVAWIHLPDDGDPPDAVFLVFHGNAGHALHRSYYRSALRRLSDDRWACAVLEYPGYGARDGTPSQRSFEEAAEEVYGILRSRFAAPVYLIGESLGSGPATALAAQHPEEVRGLLLVTPFTSLADVGRTHYPFLPVGLLLRDNFDNAANLEGYGGPVAVLVAGRDRIVPAALGEKLLQTYAGPGRLWSQPKADHNSLDLSPSHPMWREIADFLLADGKEG